MTRQRTNRQIRFLFQCKSAEVKGKIGETIERRIVPNRQRLTDPVGGEGAALLVGGDVGIRVGGRVGGDVGIRVGGRVGGDVGIRVGALEGLREGLVEGSFEGLCEGLVEGSFEGLREGLVDGFFEGL